MNRSKHLNLWLSAFAVLLGVAALPSLAEEDDSFDRTPEDCLSLSAIARTEVVDDQTILFYMRGKKAYLNYLPRKCPGLAHWNRFMYETRGGRLCSIDTVTVLEQWTSRIERGFTCGLGEFHPISPDEIEDFKLAKKGGPRPGAIESQPVELPPDRGPTDRAAPTTAEE